MILALAAVAVAVFRAREDQIRLGGDVQKQYLEGMLTLERAKSSNEKLQYGLAAKQLELAARLARELQPDEDQLGPLRDEMIACLALVDVRRVHEWPGLPLGSDDRVAFDGVFEHYARSDVRGNIEVRLTVL